MRVNKTINNWVVASVNSWKKYFYTRSVHYQEYHVSVLGKHESDVI